MTLIPFSRSQKEGGGVKVEKPCLHSISLKKGRILTISAQINLEKNRSDFVNLELNFNVNVNDGEVRSF